MESARIRSISALAIAASLWLTGSAAGTAAGQEAPKPGRTDVRRPDQAQPARADASTQSPSNEALKRLVSAVFDAIREHDADALAAQVDSDRLLMEIERQNIMSAPSLSERTALRVALRMVVGDGLTKEGADHGWKDGRIHRVGLGASSIMVRALGKDGRVVGNMQFWLTREPGGDWKLYDWQETSSVFRMSTMVAVAVAAFRGDPGSAGLQRLVAAAQAAAQGDMAASERAILELANERLPNTLEASRWLLYAQIKLSQGEPDKALECLDQAATYDPDMVVLPRSRAVVYAQLNEPNRSLECARQALKLVGNDAELDVLVGNALAQLGRAEEAAEAYRRGLDADPGSTANLLGLAGVLRPGKNNEEVIERLRRSPDAASAFPALADALVAAGDGATLARLTDGSLPVAVDEAVLDYYRGRLALLNGGAADAVKLIKQAIARAGSDEARRYYGDRLLDLQLEAGKALEAYKESAEPEYAFDYLASRLSEAENADALLALARYRAEQVSNSTDSAFYLGRALLLKTQYDEAADAFAKGLAVTASEAQRESLRSNLVFALYKAGKGLEAYRTAGAPAATFAQLAGLYLADKQPEPLLQLIAAARKADPQNSALDQWEAEARLLRNDYAGAAGRFQAALGRTSDPGQRRVITAKLLDARLAAREPVEGYAEAVDKEYALAYLGEALVRNEDRPGLAAVVEAHRARFPGDPLLRFYSGQAHMLAGEYADARKDFDAGLAQAASPAWAARFLNQRFRASCALGEALKVYDEAEDKALAYRLLGPLLIERNQADDLAALVKAHRGFAPKEPTLGLWEAEAHWLKHDYQGVVDVLKHQHDAIVADTENVPRYEDRLVRSLVRLKQFDEAAAIARRSTERDGDPLFEAIVAIASGDAQRAAPLVERCVELGYRPDNFDEDVDAGPNFKSAAFGALRKKLAQAG